MFGWKKKGPHYVVRVEGMSCQHCVAHTTEALQGVDGVRSAEVSLKKKEAQVYGEAGLEEALCAAVQEAGYTCAGVEYVEN